MSFERFLVAKKNIEEVETLMPTDLTLDELHGMTNAVDWARSTINSTCRSL